VPVALWRRDKTRAGTAELRRLLIPLWSRQDATDAGRSASSDDVALRSQGRTSLPSRAGLAAIASHRHGYRRRLPHTTVAFEEDDVRLVLLWLLGIPIPIIILLYLFHVV
jgi:hypothetical protein